MPICEPVAFGEDEWKIKIQMLYSSHPETSGLSTWIEEILRINKMTFLKDNYYVSEYIIDYVRSEISANNGLKVDLSLYLLSSYVCTT